MKQKRSILIYTEVKLVVTSRESEAGRGNIGEVGKVSKGLHEIICV